MDQRDGTSHRRDNEPQDHRHVRRNPISFFDRWLIRFKDALLIGTAIGAIVMSTLKWIQRPEVLEGRQAIYEKSQIEINQRVANIEGNIHDHDKQLNDIKNLGLKNGDRLEEVLRRMDRIETTFDRVLINQRSKGTSLRDDPQG